MEAARGIMAVMKQLLVVTHGMSAMGPKALSARLGMRDGPLWSPLST